MNQPWSFFWFWSLFVVVPVTLLARRYFQATYLYGAYNSSAPLRVPGLTIVAGFLIFGGGFLIFRESANLLAALVAAAFVLVAFGPINALWGLGSLPGAWTFLDNKYGRKFRVSMGAVLGALLSLALSVFIMVLVGAEPYGYGGSIVVTIAMVQGASMFAVVFWGDRRGDLAGK